MIYGYDQDDDDFEENVEYYAVRPNKTQIKREMAELFRLAEALSGLTAAELDTLDLPEALRKACLDAAAMPLTGARKRLLKYIAGQLHKLETALIRERLARLQNKSIHTVREHHVTERWRDRLLNEGDGALAELVDLFPDADRQKLRRLVRSAHREAETAKPPKSPRLLYRYLKELISESGDIPADSGQPSDPESTA